MKRISIVLTAAFIGVGMYFLFIHNTNSSAHAASIKLPTPVEAATAHTLAASETAEEAAEQTDQESTEPAETTQEITIPDMMIGNPDAPVTVIEYASFTCPHCAAFHQGTFKDLKRDYIDTGKINFIFREVYFDRYGLWASMIARCAGEDKFFGISNLIFDGQATWARAGDATAIVEELRKIGRLAGLEAEPLEACLSDNAKAQALVAWYQEKAGADEINSTPSFIINGKKYSNMSFEEMSEVLDAALPE